MLAWIRRARRFHQLDAAERRLVLEAALSMIAVRLALSALSLRTVRGLVARIPATARLPADGAEQVARAVTRAHAVVPGTSCLVRALGLQTLLVRRGHAAHVRLGFVKSEGRVVCGHAWVATEDRVFDDTGEACRYVPVPELEGQRS